MCPKKKALPQKSCSAIKLSTFHIRLIQRDILIAQDQPFQQIESVGLFRQQIGDQRALFLQFIFRRGDFRLAEFVERNVLDDFPFLAVAADRDS